MALDPRLVDERLLREAVGRATEKFGASPDRAWIEGNIIHVRSARKQTAFVIHESHSCDAHGVPYAGGTSWWLEELEIEEAPSFWRRMMPRSSKDE